MPPKLIRDIRYYQKPVNGKAVLNLKSLHLVGSRYVCKLRELGFETKVYDHIYLNLTSQLPHGEAEISSEVPSENWYIYINTGVLPELFEAISDNEKFLFIVPLTTKALKLLCVRDDLNYRLVEETEKVLLSDKTELEILYKIKDTKNYQISVSYQINPNNNPSIAYVSYWDKNENTKRKSILTELNNYEDIFFLINNVSVKNDIITFKPRQSFKASLYTKSYKTPLTIKVEDLKILSEDTNLQSI